MPFPLRTVALISRKHSDLLWVHRVLNSMGNQELVQSMSVCVAKSIDYVYLFRMRVKFERDQFQGGRSSGPSNALGRHYSTTIIPRVRCILVNCFREYSIQATLQASF